MAVAWIWWPQDVSALPSVMLGMLSVFTCLHSTQSPVLTFDRFPQVAFRCASGRPPCPGSLQSLRPQFTLCFSLFFMFQPLWLSFQFPPTYYFPVTGPFSQPGKLFPPLRSFILQLSVPGLLRKAPSSFAVFSIQHIPYLHWDLPYHICDHVHQSVWLFICLSWAGIRAVLLSPVSLVPHGTSGTL